MVNDLIRGFTAYHIARLIHHSPTGIIASQIKRATAWVSSVYLEGRTRVSIYNPFVMTYVTYIFDNTVM